MRGVADERALQPSEQLLAAPLALLEAEFGDVFAVEMQQIEHEIREPRARYRRGRFIERRRARTAVGKHQRDLAVEQDPLSFQALQSGDDFGKSPRPVLAARALQ